MKIFVIKKPYFWESKQINTVCFDIFIAFSKYDIDKQKYDRIIQNIDVAREYSKDLRRKHNLPIVFIDETLEK